VLHFQVASLAAAAVAAVLVAPAPAAAHPHVMINMTAGVQFTDDGRILGVGTEWIFDPEYSAMAIEGLDTDKDGKYSAAELKPLATENMQALKDYSYFIYAYANGQKVKWKDVTRYEQHLGDDGRLRLYFVTEAPEPLDPQKAGFLFRVYDPSFFIAMEFLGDKPVEMLGKPPAGCQVKVENPPDLNETADTKAMLATKGPEWQPDSEEDFGIMFAQPVSVACKTATQ
jgi:ABC-type uncharacterized transport system substrate-binding protein